MGRYVIRRVLLAIPTLILISLIIFTILELAPGDPTSQLPLTLTPEQRDQIRESLGFNDSFMVKWLKWNRLMFINEPLHLLDTWFNVCIGDCDSRDRIISSSSRAPAMDIIYERLPQTLWVLGTSFVIGTMLAIPIAVRSAYKQYSAFDNAGTFITMIGYSAPTYFTGLLMIVIFSVWLKWFPSFYSTTHDIDFTSWSSIWFQIKQMIMPVVVLTFFNAAILSRFARSAVLDNLNEDYVLILQQEGRNGPMNLRSLEKAAL